MRESLQEGGKRALPVSTGDLDVAREDIAVWGYALIANALTGEEVRGCRERLRSQAAAEEAAGIGHFDNGELKLNQRVWNLVNKGKMCTRKPVVSGSKR